MCLTDDWPGRAREAHLSGPLMPFKTRLTVPFSIETLVEDHEGLLLPLFQVHWSPLALSSYTRRNRVFVLWCRMDVSLSLQSLSSLTRDARCVFIQRVLFAPHIALRLFYTFYCFCFIVYFSADSSGCDVCGLEGGICLQSIYCLFICTGLSHPEVRRPLSLELQSRLWDPPSSPPLNVCLHWSFCHANIVLWLSVVFCENCCQLNFSSDFSLSSSKRKFSKFFFSFFTCFLTNVRSSV